jgi:hypothetical protein
MAVNITNMLLAQLLMSPRASRARDRSGSSPRELVQSTQPVWSPREQPLRFEERWPTGAFGLGTPEQRRWSQDDQWPLEDAFQRLPPAWLRMMEERRRGEESRRWEQDRRWPSDDACDTPLLRLIRDWQQQWPAFRDEIRDRQEREEWEREDRLRNGQNMTG